MGIYEEFLEYRDKYGLNQSVKATTQNGVLFTVEYLFCYINYPESSVVTKQEEVNRIRAVMDSCEPYSGLMSRYPDDKEFNSMDNVTAALVFSAIFDNRRFAERMRDIGLDPHCLGREDDDLSKKTYWIARMLGLGSAKNYFNHVEPRKFCFFSWFGRSPGLMGLLDIAATRDSTPFRKFSMLVGQLIPCFSRAQDGWKLSYLVWQLVKDRGVVWTAAYRWWKKRLLKYYPKGMAEVYGAYYGSEHPIARYTWQD